MLADLVPAEQRTDAYAMMRLSANAGIAIGPIIGGVIAATSYYLAFYMAALGMTTYSLLLAIFAHETLPRAGWLPWLPLRPASASAATWRFRVTAAL